MSGQSRRSFNANSFGGDTIAALVFGKDLSGGMLTPPRAPSQAWEPCLPCPPSPGPAAFSGLPVLTGDKLDILLCHSLQAPHKGRFLSAFLPSYFVEVSKSPGLGEAFVIFQPNLQGSTIEDSLWQD